MKGGGIVIIEPQARRDLEAIFDCIKESVK